MVSNMTSRRDFFRPHSAAPRYRPHYIIVFVAGRRYIRDSCLYSAHIYANLSVYRIRKYMINEIILRRHIGQRVPSFGIVMRFGRRRFVELSRNRHT